MARLAEDDVERYVAGKLREGKAPKTIRNHLGVVHSIFVLGQRRKWCTQNPVKLAEGPKIRRNHMRIRFLTQEELQALVRAPYPDEGVSASAYYERNTGGRSRLGFEDERLLGRIREVHAANYYAYGIAAVWIALRRAGEPVARCTVERLMKAHGIQSEQADDGQPGPSRAFACAIRALLSGCFGGHPELSGRARTTS